MTIGEVERGITRQKQVNTEFAQILENWLEGILTRLRATDIAFDDRNCKTLGVV